MRRWSLVFALSLLLLAFTLHAPALRVIQDTTRAVDNGSSFAGKHAATLTPPAPQAAVTMNISQAAANNFTIGMTGFSVSFVPNPNVYRVYGTGGYHNLRWNVNNNFTFTKYHRTVNWPDFALAFNGIGDCAHSEDPRSMDRKCATEAVGYFWKRVTCPSPNPGNVACPSNERWNGSPGTFNITPTPTPGVWPNSFSQGYGTPGYTPVIDIESVNNVALKPAETCATPYGQTIWVNDTTPLDAVPDGNESWTWVTTGPTPFHGQYAHQSVNIGGIHQHFFTNASNKLDVEVGDKLIAYVYLDSSAPPSQVMLQWNDGTWDHRAYWAPAPTNQIPWGIEGTVSRRYMGQLPPVGQWVKLEVSASQVGLEGKTLNGMAFTLFGGRATWDFAGKIKPPPAGTCPPKTGVNGKNNGFHAYNPNDFATGVANSKAVQVKYPDGTSRWFMAFNKMIHPVSVTYYDPATGARTNPSLGAGGADNWQVLWATSPDGVTWTVHDQVLFRSIKERDANWTGPLLVDMFVEGDYFYVLFQDLVEPHLYLARGRINLGNPASVAGYLQNATDGWSVASYPLVNGQYTWRRIPLGQQINFYNIEGTSAYPVMPAINAPGGGFVKQGTIARIFKSAAANSQSRFFGVTNDFDFAAGTATRIQLWSTADINSPFQYESDIQIPSSVPGVLQNGWEASFLHYVDNTPATPRIISTGLELWYTEANRGLVRHTATLSNF